MGGVKLGFLLIVNIYVLFHLSLCTYLLVKYVYLIVGYNLL